MSWMRRGPRAGDLAFVAHAASPFVGVDGFPPHPTGAGPSRVDRPSPAAAGSSRGKCGLWWGPARHTHLAVPGPLDVEKVVGPAVYRGRMFSHIGVQVADVDA